MFWNLHLKELMHVTIAHRSSCDRGIAPDICFYYSYLLDKISSHSSKVFFTFIEAQHHETMHHCISHGAPTLLAFICPALGGQIDF